MVTGSTGTIPSGTVYLLSRQTNDVGNWTNIVGTPPTNGATVYQWTGSNYNTYTFTAGAWSPSAPGAAVGEAVWAASCCPPPAPFPMGSQINFALIGGNLTLRWNGNGVLQSSTNLSTWADVAGASSPYTVAPISPRKFYRVRQ